MFELEIYNSDLRSLLDLLSLIGKHNSGEATFTLDDFTSVIKVNKMTYPTLYDRVNYSKDEDTLTVLKGETPQYAIKYIKIESPIFLIDK